MSTRRALLLAGTGLVAAGLARAAAPGHALLPQPASLAAELRSALAGGKALVVLASLDGCTWCKLVRESYLVPLRAAGQPVVQLDMNRAAPLADFRGGASTHAQVVRGLAVRVAPTVLFFGADGREVAPRLVGVPLPDFYGAYLEERVAAANRAIA